ncbi:MAG: BLUF domain-containing protein [Parvibaculum sp.]|nr:BLUF domain-containing protein [Parvibaculum sp.]
MIYQTAYFSSAVDGLSEDDIALILAKSQTNNKALGVTGMLLLMDQVFFQVLEGEENVVEALIGRIEKNLLHNGLIRLVSVEREDRLFPDWSMGFEKVMRGSDGNAMADEMPFDMNEFSQNPTISVLAKKAPEILVFMRSLYSSRHMIGAPSLDENT